MSSNNTERFLKSLNSSSSVTSNKLHVKTSALTCDIAKQYDAIKSFIIYDVEQSLDLISLPIYDVNRQKTFTEKYIQIPVTRYDIITSVNRNIYEDDILFASHPLNIPDIIDTHVIESNNNHSQILFTPDSNNYPSTHNNSKEPKSFDDIIPQLYDILNTNSSFKYWDSFGVQNSLYGNKNFDDFDNCYLI